MVNKLLSYPVYCYTEKSSTHLTGEEGVLLVIVHKSLLNYVEKI